jgi:hypothetical protein
MGVDKTDAPNGLLLVADCAVGQIEGRFSESSFR